MQYIVYLAVVVPVEDDEDIDELAIEMAIATADTLDRNVFVDEINEDEIDEDEE